ncbi:MinD/ParA family protein, partial [Borreliella burgdorferi]
KKIIIKNLKSLKYDYLVIDLGAGTAFNIIDFFLMSKRGVIVTTPTVTATMNAYLFLKNIIFRLLSSVFKRGTKGNEILRTIKQNSIDLQRVYIPNLLLKLESEDPENYSKFNKLFKTISPFMIFNMLKAPKDIEKTEKIIKSAKNYLSINLQSIGAIYKDEIVDQALNSKIPITIYKPTSSTSKSIKKIAKKLIEIEDLTNDAELLNEEDLNESYDFVLREAQEEYIEKIEYLESLIKNKTIESSEIIDIIKSQKREIETLRKQNMLFKKKLVEKLEKAKEV